LKAEARDHRSGIRAAREKRSNPLTQLLWRVRVLRGLPAWNLDATAPKDFRIGERVGSTIMIQASNVLNHFPAVQPDAGYRYPETWGVINGRANKVNLGFATAQLRRLG
jgi:hypothetical protein